MIITGPITWQAEMRFTYMGRPVCLISIEVDSAPVRCVAFDAVAEEIALDDRYQEKGRYITLEGYYKERVYARDGEQRKVTEFIIKEVM